MRFLQSPSSRWLAGVALAVLALVIVSVVLALVNRRGVNLFPEGTPEGVVQRYVLALQEGDGKTAYSYLSSELQEYCEYRHFLDSTEMSARGDVRVALEATEELDGEVQVRVKVTEVRFSRPFGTSESSYDVRYYLEKEGNTWRFSQPPWPMGWCPGLEGKTGPRVPLPSKVD